MIQMTGLGGERNQIVLFGGSRGNTIKYEAAHHSKLQPHGKQSLAKDENLSKLNNT